MGKLNFAWHGTMEAISNLFSCRNGQRHQADLPASLEGKVFIVTGAALGVGFEATKALAKLGATVVMACRNMNQGRAKRIAICNELDHEEDQCNLLLLPLDLASFESIRSFVKLVQARFNSIDCLIANAGLYKQPQSSTVEGFEMHFGVNHLGHFLLTQLLFEQLKRAKAARVVVVSSLLARKGKIYWDNINLNGCYSWQKAYAQSKFANVLFAAELAKKAQAARTSVTSYSLHPGIVRTDGFEKAFSNIMHSITIDSRLGAQTTLYCALEEGIESLSGCFFENCRKTDIPAVTEKAAADIWSLSLKLCNLEEDLIVKKKF